MTEQIDRSVAAGIMIETALESTREVEHAAASVMRVFYRTFGNNPESRSILIRAAIDHVLNGRSPHTDGVRLLGAMNPAFPYTMGYHYFEGGS